MPRYLSIIVVILIMAQVAHADQATAKKAYDKGMTAYDLQHYDDALVMFQRAYEELHDPAFLFNIGQCQRQLGQYEAAAKSYRSYVSRSPNAPNREQALKLAEKMDDGAKQERAKVQPVATQPPAEAAQPSPALTLTSSPAPKSTPVYKRWWFWTAAGVVVAGAAAGIAVGVTNYQRTPTASTALGTVKW